MSPDLGANDQNGFQIYFCRFIIDPYLSNPRHSSYIDRDVLDRYWKVGGVRIEGMFFLLRSKPHEIMSLGLTRHVDNILVTETGYNNLTTAIKDVDQMTRIIQESDLLDRERVFK